jgi:hypothetical protein
VKVTYKAYLTVFHPPVTSLAPSLSNTLTLCILLPLGLEIKLRTHTERVKCFNFTFFFVDLWQERKVTLQWLNKTVYNNMRDRIASSPDWTTRVWFPAVSGFSLRHVRSHLSRLSGWYRRISAPPCVFMAWRLIEHRRNLSALKFNWNSFMCKSFPAHQTCLVWIKSNAVLLKLQLRHGTCTRV